jgi:hypothetical protein
MNHQYIILFHHFKNILKMANKKNIAIIPLKGAHLLTSVYSAKENRGFIGDVDFLVKPRDWQHMLALMEEYGFKPRSGPNNENNMHEKGFYFYMDNGARFLFEVHRYIFEPARFKIDHNGIWSRAYKSDFEGVPCYRMSDEDVFCHVAWHDAIHRLMSHKRTMRDLELILTQSGVDVNKIATRAVEWQCTKTVWLYLYLLNRQLPGIRNMEKAIRGIAPSFFSQAAIISLIGYGDKTRISAFNHRVQAAVLWPFLFDSKRLLIKMIANHPASPLSFHIRKR